MLGNPSAALIFPAGFATLPRLARIGHARRKTGRAGHGRPGRKFTETRRGVRDVGKYLETDCDNRQKLKTPRTAGSFSQRAQPWRTHFTDEVRRALERRPKPSRPAQNSHRQSACRQEEK